MFKAAEIGVRNIQIDEKENDKKSRIEFSVKRDVALPVLDRLTNELDENVLRLTSKVLEVLLRWKGVPVFKMVNVANRRELYQQLCRRR
jgi:hypothetical protein